MKYIKIIFAAIFLLSINLSVFSQEFPERPTPPRLVNDFADFLSQNEEISLERKLVEFNNEISTQIAIVIVNSLYGYEKGDYSFRLAEKWGIGQKGKDNGILILVKPKTRTEKGDVFIATGYGLEGVVPDAIAKRIVENEIIPYFKQGKFYDGLNAATNTLISLTKGEFTADEYTKSTQGVPTAIPFIIFIVIFLIFSIIGRAQKARKHSIGHNIPFWIALGMMSSGSHRGSYSNFSSGSGGFGGGGFGGFGGGSFGGGGAGGSW